MKPPGPTTRTARDRLTPSEPFSKTVPERSVIDASTRPSTTKNAATASEPALKSVSPCSTTNVFRVRDTRMAAAANASEAMEPTSEKDAFSFFS